MKLLSTWILFYFLYSLVLENMTGPKLKEWSSIQTWRVEWVDSVEIKLLDPPLFSLGLEYDGDLKLDNFVCITRPQGPWSKLCSRVGLARGDNRKNMSKFSPTCSKVLCWRREGDGEKRNNFFSMCFQIFWEKNWYLSK